MMKKEYFAPEVEKIEFLTESLMGPSDVLDLGNGSDGDVTEILPMVNLFN